MLERTPLQLKRSAAGSFGVGRYLIKVAVVSTILAALLVGGLMLAAWYVGEPPMVFIVKT